MKIGIDARLYGAKHAGLGRFAEQVIKNLEILDKENEYFIFLQKDGYEAYIPANPNFKKVLADYKVYGLSEQIKLPLLMKKYNLDLAFFTHFNVPVFYNKKYVVTIHDLIISHYPTTRATTLPPWIYGIKLFFYRLVISMAAKRAKKIIAVSNYTKNDITKLLNIKPQKVEVIYEGVDLPKNESNKGLCEKLGINGNFLLYVGSAYPHKNLETLIESFNGLHKEYRDLQLVLVGKTNQFYEKLKQFAKGACDPKAFENIIFTGYLSDEDLAVLYNQASAYVFPSLIEGFGLPPLEAQQHGLPVVSSNATCLPEILGESALYFDPKDVNQMKEMTSILLKDNSERERLIKAGYDNLKRFSWNDCGKKILNLFHLLK